jgi:hypothetical protein
MSEGEKISIRGFAKLMQVSDTAVRKHMYHKDNNPTGELKNCISQKDNGQPILLKDVAIAEWNAANLGLHALNYATSAEGVRGGAQDILPDGPPSPQRSMQDMDEGEQAKGDLMKIKKMHAGYSAKMMQLKYQKESGILVEKSRVFEVLYVFAQQIRDELIQIPDRIIDRVRRADTDKEAHTILYDEMQRILEKLTAGPTEKMTENDTGDVTED